MSEREPRGGVKEGGGGESDPHEPRERMQGSDARRVPAGRRGWA